jgi:hypothetical protein
MDSIISYINKKPNIQNEKDIVYNLNRSINGKLEIKTKVGAIDILSDTEIIEVKEYSYWKAALGQILTYSNYYPYKVKRIHLFNIPDKNIINEISKIYSKYDVILTYEKNEV